MKIAQEAKGITLTAAAFLLAALPAEALSAHTWVSGTGNDANSGTFESPYADFATAVANTSAGGTVSCVGPGDYGPVTLTQSVTIEGVPGATITFPADGEAIYGSLSPGAAIVLRNLTVDGQGTGSDGIFIANATPGSAATSVVIDNCHVVNCVQIAIGLGDESLIDLVVRNTSIDNCEIGIRTFQNGTTFPVTTFAHVHLYNVHISNASTAGVFTRNGTLDMRLCEVTDSDVGIECDTYAIISADSCTMSNDTQAIISYTNSVIRISNCDLWDCGSGIVNGGGTVYSDGTNKKGGLTGGSIPPNATMGHY